MTMLSLSLSPAAEARLRERAAASGQPLDAYAAAVLEQAATTPSLDEILAPVRRQVADAGMTDGEFDAFVEEVRDEAHQERRRRGA
jgi:hypothetical protein